MKNNKVIWIDKENKNRTMSNILEEVWVNIDTHKRQSKSELNRFLYAFR
jgi:hypothetical protein